MLSQADNLSAISIEPRTLVELLRHRADFQRDRLAYIFLVDGENREDRITYGELDCRARSVAALLQSLGAEGERALLIYPSGLDYIAAFFGCLYAGAIAVPAYPPRLAHMNRSFHRIKAIIDDSQPAIVLSTSSILSKLKSVAAQAPDLRKMRWIATDDVAIELADQWKETPIGSAPAFLQYTSGSTSAPKGVMVTHENLLHNERLIKACFQQSELSRIVGWLPLYHDMGLIGNVLHPLCVGALSILMSPVSFLQSPFRWLQAISRYRATTSGGPNFSYELCLRKISDEQRNTLDLSSWNTAFNGAEPIKNETMERFAQAFEPCGFQREAFFPCYGLAEATLIVSGGAMTGPCLARTVQAAALEKNKVVLANGEHSDSRTLLSCGRPLLDQRIVIVDPESLTLSPPDSVGEIWVSGQSVAQGYWNQPEHTSQTFHAYLTDTGEGPFLRTGDLGFLKDGELFVTGRLKDLIVIRGRNLYPQDIEFTVESSHPALRRANAAAFSIEIDGEEHLVVVQEVEYRQRPNVAEVIETIRRAIAEEYEAQVYAIALIKAGTISKTSSGKIRRRDCRLKFLAGSLDLIAEWRMADKPAESESPFLHFAAPLPDSETVESWLIALIAAKLKVNATEIDVNRPVISYGIDSMMTVELAHEIESRLKIVLSPASFLVANIADLVAQTLVQGTIASPNEGPRPVSAENATAEHPLSYGQRSLWFLRQLAPDDTAYNLAHAVRVRSELNVRALRKAFQQLIDRHPCLRTTFDTTQGGAPVQRVHDYAEVCFQEIDAVTYTEGELSEYLTQESNRTFSLDQGPMLCVSLFRRPSHEYILLVVLHHIIADFWSLAILMNELGILYTAEDIGCQAPLTRPTLQYSDYVYWQEKLLTSSTGDDLYNYWKNQLEGDLPVLNLPTDRPRPLIQTYRGASQSFQINVEVTDKLKAFCRNSNTTFFMGLLASVQAFLHRYTRQEDILVGAPASGRSRADLAEIVGYFVNPVVLRADLSNTPTFEEFLRQVRLTVLAAFEYQEYPFALLVERLQPNRDPGRSPLFQTMFSFHNLHLPGEQELASFALGEAGAKMQLGRLSIESVALQQRVAQFDLTLTMTETAGGVKASICYNTDLFDALTIERMIAHFCTMLDGIVLNPSQHVSDLTLLTESERRQVMVEWNDTALNYHRNKCLHELFEARVRRMAESVALIFEDQQLSYGELNRRANHLAHYLRQVGVKPEQRVGIFIARSIEMVIGMIGILKAGGAYVPLDPTYPKERLSLMLEDAGVKVLLTQPRLFDVLSRPGVRAICLDTDRNLIAQGNEEDPVSVVTSDNIAYVIYTSGSTGQPKGVMVLHRNIVNFCRAMDEVLGSETPGVWLAVTSMSFDISVLELLWTLASGFKVIIQGEQEGAPSILGKRGTLDQRLDFSLFYFASDGSANTKDLYRLLIEGAKFADQHGFSAVWTPERHFHPFGGLYPNPSVIGAAIATITRRVQIRAGSVVLPLHHPVRVAEEWSVVDNLSKGRAGVSFASGWHADDFILAPENYASRKEIMAREIETVRKLWRGESIRVRSGAGDLVDVKILPRPIQKELPMWITAAGSPETFLMAGEMGTRLLTHLLGQSLEELEEKIKLYRRAWQEHHRSSGSGYVTLMLHTFIGEDIEEVREKVRRPFYDYLRSSIELIKNLAKSLGKDLDPKNITEDDMQALLSHAFDRYFQTSGLIGVPRTCLQMIEQIKAVGVDEVACLIDFGVDADSVLESLGHLDSLRKQCNEKNMAKREDYSVAAQIVRHGVSHLQCTPSLAKMMTLDVKSFNALEGLKKILLGGEAVPLSLAQDLGRRVKGDLQNMYGPTETTVWSTAALIDKLPDKISIGRPIANTEVYIADNRMKVAPVNVPGELHIGGEGVVRGYLNLPDLTAERFIPNSFGTGNGVCLYKTGDLARYQPDGRLEFLGRLDHQVKIRGFRIELGEIEATLLRHPYIREAVVLVEKESMGEARLVAYVVAEGQATSVNKLRAFIKEKLPDHMAPSSFVMLEALPKTPNGKIDRGALLAIEHTKPRSETPYVAPDNAFEDVLAGIWADLLGLNQIGVLDDFFELGGHSMLASQLVIRLREMFKIEFPLRAFFQAPTIAGMARVIDENPKERMRVERIAELLISVAQYSEDEVEAMLNERS
jgi:natural product biosynthesis luciferase-like monooxygenase protein